MPGKAQERLMGKVGKASLCLAFHKEKAILLDDSDNLGRFDAEAHPTSRDHFRKPVGYPPRRGSGQACAGNIIGNRDRGTIGLMKSIIGQADLAFKRGGEPYLVQ